jgi:DNA-binding transcriptional LysR family regulator
MILDGVDVFVKVVEAGGFSAAARQLGMPATTVSAKVARLEERLGVTLIQRSTRKMHVTDAGEAYYAHCAEALRALEAGEQQLQADTGEPSGLLRITVPSDLAQNILPPIIERFLAAYPRIGIELIVSNVPIDLLAEGIDLAVRASPMKDSSLQSRKFASGALGLFATKAYLGRRGTPKAPADIAGHDVLAHSKFPPALLRMVAGRESFDLAPTKRIRVDDMQALRALAVQGLGIALLPDFAGDEGGLVQVLPEYSTPSGNVYFVYPAGRFTPLNVKAFIDTAVGKA